MNNILLIIPARGGSKGIPRKNLRSLNGNPLITYAIKTALSSKYNPDIYVSSEDDEILTLAKKLNVNILKREIKLADDKSTLDEVIVNDYKKITQQKKKDFELIITLQPTSPLLNHNTLDDAIEKILTNKGIDTIISGKEDTHLTWTKEQNKFKPNYKERVNRQYLPKVYRETGSFIITRPNILSSGTRIGKNVELYLLHNGEDIDIDNYEDWSICEYYLQRKKILFVVTGHSKIGLGHVYRSLVIANNILNHHVEFLVDSKSQLGFEKIKESNYPVFIQKSETLLECIKKLDPDIVINDILDTDEDYMASLKEICDKVINFEDLGLGTRYADLLINALYPENKKVKNHFYGHKYFCPRDEFILTKQKKISPDIKRILITFGGTDPNNYTLKVLESIYTYCLSEKIEIQIILGLGYTHDTRNLKKDQVKVFQNINNISDYMHESDIIFTSAGRTVYEIACIGTPTIVLAQNERELTHLFASSENGFLNLGLGFKLTNDKIWSVFSDLCSNFKTRQELSKRMLRKDIRKGKERVLQLINKIIELK